MVKILSQGGRSLADMYDVRGSIAGIDELESREVSLVHEMGATLFSERFRTAIRRVSSGNILQNTNFDLVITNLPTSISRLLGIAVISDVAARVDHVAASVRTTNGDREIPVWAFDGSSVSARFVDDGAPVARYDLLGGPQNTFIPTFVGGADQGSNPVNQLVLRGRSTGFGAGNVVVIGLFFIALTFTSGVSAFGAHVPSW